MARSRIGIANGAIAVASECDQVVGDGERGDDTVGSPGAQRPTAGCHDESGAGNHGGKQQEVAGCDDEEVGAE